MVTLKVVAPVVAFAMTLIDKEIRLVCFSDTCPRSCGRLLRSADAAEMMVGKPREKVVLMAEN